MHELGNRSAADIKGSYWEPKSMAFKKRKDDDLTYFCMKNTGVYGDLVRCKAVDGDGYDCKFYYDIWDPRDQKNVKRGKKIGNELFTSIVGLGVRTTGTKHNILEIESDGTGTRCFILGKGNPKLLCSHPSKMSEADRDNYDCMP
jgi:hypothetical protein